MTELEDVVKAPDGVARFWIALAAFSFVAGGMILQVTDNQKEFQEDLDALEVLVHAMTVNLASEKAQVDTFQRLSIDSHAETNRSIQALSLRVNNLHQ